VVLWSIGNEEWGIEGNEKGERIASTMQSLVHRLDPTRPVTVASSGSWGQGVSVPIEVMGFNYYTHGDGDQYHRKFPDKASIGTEEGSTFSTRGVYVEDRDQQHLTAYDENCPDWGALAHKGWGHYADRQYVAGVFIWTGFDYRGEPTPFSWPAISSQFGILDTCGFRKDNSYYYQSQWTQEPVLHLLPHWNWLGKEGQPIRVWAHTNCDEVELLLNDRSLGRRQVERLSHAEWEVPYEPGILLASGFNQGEKVIEHSVETTGPAVAIKLTPHRPTLQSNDHQDVAIVTVEVVDAEGRHVPTANDEVKFEISGGGRILGVGNGDPSSHEPDQFLDQWSSIHPTWKRRIGTNADQPAVMKVSYDDSGWVASTASSRSTSDKDQGDYTQGRFNIFRGTFDKPDLDESSEVQLLTRGLTDAVVYINGNPCELSTGHNQQRVVTLDLASLDDGKNVITIVSPQSSQSDKQFDSKSPAIVKIKTPAAHWKRSLFNGLAQVIVQSASESGELKLVAKAPGLENAVLTISTEP
jgi:beta-galactosidase